jgi:hypothetical protein
VTEPPTIARTAGAGEPETATAQPLGARLRGPIPIVVGVTGHREVLASAIPELEERIAGIFRELASRFPHTPLVLLSALAAGSDRIAAKVAMRPAFAIPVIAILPFERAEYENDFTPAELAEFRTLMDRTYSSFFVGYASGNDAAAVATTHAAREHQYAQVGAFLARHCQVLVALWNGEQSGAVGGTAQNVGFKRDGVPPEYGPERSPIDPPEVGPVRQIVTPRNEADRDRLGDAACTQRILPPHRGGSRASDARDERVAEATFHSLELFNRRAAGIGKVTEHLSAAALREAADALSVRFRDRNALTVAALFVLAFFTAGSFELFAHLGSHPWQAAAVDLALSIAGLVWYSVARTKRWQDSFQDYRAIAEALRIQQQWQEIGLDETVADHYLRQHRGELDWIRDVVRTCRLLDRLVPQPVPEPIAERARSLRAVCAAWISGPDGQIAYFHDRIARNVRREAAFNGLTIAMLAATLVLTVFGLLVAVAPHAVPGRWSRPDSLDWTVLVMAIALTAVGAALARGYANNRVYAEQRKQYQRMLSVFRYANAELNRIFARTPFGEADYREACDIVLELGNEALTENAAWVMLHRERQLEYLRG